jgi:hypothetical protein
MSDKRIMDGWECGMCFEAIDNQPHVRIAVDVAVEEDIGGVSSLMGDEVVMLGVFHTSCVSETRDDESLEDEVPYLREARLLTDALSSSKKKPAPAPEKPRLQLLNGGAR